MRTNLPRRALGLPPPAISFKSVDLPVPFSPTIARRAPRFTVRLPPENSVLPPAERVRFFISSTDSALGEGNTNLNLGGAGGVYGFSSISILSSLFTRLKADFAVVARTMFLST